MTDRTLEKIRAAAIVVLLVCMAHAAGCASVQTAGTQQIDKILTDGTLDKPTISATDRGRIKAVLTQAKSEIVTATIEQEKAEKSAERSKAWAQALGTLAAGLGGALIFFFILGRLIR